jgi:hypothetical protein
MTALSLTDQLVRRVRAEYREMPGLNLTLRQAMRLWVLDESTCTSVLRSLLEQGFLIKTGAGQHKLAG